MSDLLTAASLLLAVVGVLYGLWYPEIMAALAEQVPKHAEDRNRPYGRVSSILASRAVPLSIAATLVALIFLPESARIIIASIGSLRQSGLGRYLAAYDTVRTAFCAVEILAVGISVHSLTLLIKLIQLRRKLRPVNGVG